MKKVTKTTTSTPATSAPVPAKKTSEKPTKKPPAKSTTAADMPAAKPVTAPVTPKPATTAPAIKAAPAPVVSTLIAAKIDVGFGNTLYIRGDGPGLSWEKGVPLDNVTDDNWSITLAESTSPIVFKFLINDLTWSTGEDFVSRPGSSIEHKPKF